MPFTKEKAKRAEFVFREVQDLLKAINSNVVAVAFIDRGDYEAVLIESCDGSEAYIDVTGTSLTELVITVLEKVEADGEDEV